jgi:hypothetical protein
MCSYHQLRPDIPLVHLLVACVIPPRTKNISDNSEIKGCKDGKQGVNFLQMQYLISITISTNKGFNMLNEADECVPILEYFIVTTCLTNKFVKDTGETWPHDHILRIFSSLNFKSSYLLK